MDGRGDRKGQPFAVNTDDLTARPIASHTRRCIESVLIFTDIEYARYS